MFNRSRVLIFAFPVTAVIGSVLAVAQTPATPAPIARFAASTANLKGGPDSVRIDVFAWSSDAVRSQLVDAWNLIVPPPAVTARGGARRGAEPAATPEAPAPARGGATGRGARGARGGPPAAPRGDSGGVAAGARDTPEKALAAAIQSAETVGYLWTSESTGYSLRYAYRFAQPDGSERIILATDRRLGGWDDSWMPAAGTGSDYAFSVIELRLNARHEGEGKTSLVGRVAVDGSANMIALEGYATLPVTLKNVRPRTTY